MSETTEIDYVKMLQESAEIMYVTINGVFELHAPEDKEELVVCGYCTALAKEDIFYPCPTASILLADMVIDSSEPAESEEPSA
jgi:hypothetical protein